METTLLAWSGGKDSALTLHALREAGQHEVTALLTTMTEDYDRITMHGIRRSLLEEQAAAMGIPVDMLYLTKNASMEEYETKLSAHLEAHRASGVTSMAFGDIFLEDLRADREAQLERIGMKALFPIWKRDTTELAHTFLELGFKAVITCVDTQLLDGRFAGRAYDTRFLADLPEGVDPCGENGEFHSFVYDGPIFRAPIPHALGEVVLRQDRFCFCDVTPLGHGTCPETMAS